MRLICSKHLTRLFKKALVQTSVPASSTMPTVDDNDSNEYEDVTDNCDNDCDISQRAMVMKEEPSLSSLAVGDIESYASELKRGLDCVIHGICSSGMDVLR